MSESIMESVFTYIIILRKCLWLFDVSIVKKNLTTKLKKVNQKLIILFHILKLNPLCDTLNMQYAIIYLLPDTQTHTHSL